MTVAADPWRLTFARRARHSPGRAPRPDARLHRRRRARYRATRATATAPRRRHRRRDARDERPGAAARSRVRIRRDGDGIIAVEATVSGGRPVTRTAVGFTRRRRRALPRLRRALERRRPARQHRRELRRRRALPARGARRRSPASCRRRASAPRDDSTYFPIPWVALDARLRRAARQRRELVLRHGRRAAPTRGAMEANAQRAVVPRLRRPAPARRRRPHEPSASAASRAPPRRSSSARGGSPRTATTPTSRRCATPTRRPRVAQTYTHYLPCGDQVGKTDAERARVQKFHDAGLAVTTYFNPMICQGQHPAFDEAASRGLLTKNALGQPYLYRYTGSEQFLVGQFDFAQPGGGRLLRPAARRRRSTTATTAGWRTSASTRRPTRAPRERQDRRGRAQPLRRRLPPRRVRVLSAARASRSRASTAPAGPAPRAARRSSGAATRRPTGASTACGRRSGRG